jgi:hypothetical protein
MQHLECQVVVAKVTVSLHFRLNSCQRTVTRTPRRHGNRDESPGIASGIRVSVPNAVGSQALDSARDAT